jgi:elongator complex protein 4
MLKTKEKNILSSGNLFLDKITGGGLALGTIVLLIEDSPSRIYETFLKYFLAEGVVNGQKCFFYHSNPTSFNNIYKQLPYKSTQVDSILNAKKVNNTSEMKIAWRYENIKYSNLLEDITKSTDYIFDLSRELQDIYLTDKNKGILVEHELLSDGCVSNLEEIKEFIIKDYQGYYANLSEDEVKYTRFVVPNLFHNDIGVNRKDKSVHIGDLKVKLSALKNIARSINGIIYLTVDKEFLNPDVFNTLVYFSDYVFELKSFVMDPQKLEDYDALFYVRKLPRVCALKSSADLETDTYGVIVEKRKVIIEKIDIGIEIDRNTKVKEKDITASQAMCGSEKYSKNYEF